MRTKAYSNHIWNKYRYRILERWNKPWINPNNLFINTNLVVRYWWSWTSLIPFNREPKKIIVHLNEVIHVGGNLQHSWCFACAASKAVWMIAMFSLRSPPVPPISAWRDERKKFLHAWFVNLRLVHIDQRQRC